MSNSVILYDGSGNVISSTNPLNVQLAGSKTGKKVSANFTRPDNATAYTAGDVVGTDPAANLSFASMGVAGDEIVILSARLLVKKAATNLALPSGCTGFRLHLFSEAPTAIADNTAFALPYADADKYIGNITISTPTDKGDALFSQDDGINMPVNLVGTGIYGILETIGAYTPTALAVKTISLHYSAI